MTHKDICITFELGGQWYEAVGFLENGEKSCLVSEVFRRVDNGRLVRTSDDFYTLLANSNDIPHVLTLVRLVTAYVAPGDSDAVGSLVYGRTWINDWSSTDAVEDVKWNRLVLIVRRRD